MINRQKIYNRVRKHLLTQGEKALDDAGSCQYRTYDPNTKRVLKCAIGCLVPFRHYNPAMEGGSANSLRVESVLAASISGFDPASADSYFLSGLQSIHDSYFPDLWEQELDAFAEREGLVVE